MTQSRSFGAGIFIGSSERCEAVFSLVNPHNLKSPGDNEVAGDVESAPRVAVQMEVGCDAG